jgi:hypothetical protein
VSDDFFTLRQTSGEMVIDNLSNRPLAVSVFLANGQNVYSVVVNHSLTINKNQLPKGVLILNINNDSMSVSKKIVM